ncbi:helix-turn-helix domain-containing protein [uncultured Bacteroides sp.]|uniref:AraC family transcriptional regulator n=1 Tax=uncultured Bacteroides sp. TaxID=162156 RepID=UPI002638142D|nr:helix-turn-helix domain-containing protein [uncultured Bacteroides sp.]
MDKEKDVENEGIAYKDDRVIILSHVNEVNLINHSPIKTEWFIVVLCTKGKAELKINKNLYSLKENDLLICHPQTILENEMTGSEFNVCGFCLSPEYIRQTFVITANNWNAKLFLENNPILSLDNDECELFLQYYSLIKSRLTSKSTHKKQVLDLLLQAFMYEFQDGMDKHVNLNPPRYNSADNLFSSFIELIANSYPKERSVNYYAEKLFVTPKYLSAICKEACGETTSDIITRYVKKDIETQLKDPQISIKEIANRLKFENLSFFGKYVKRNFGVSPREYRENITENKK